MGYYDVAEQFTERARGIPYPEMPQKPERGDLTPSAYGRAIAAYEKAKDVAYAGRKDYDTLHAQCDDDFKAALAVELGLDGHPKYDLLFRLAWQEGHSGGYSEVASCADTFAELLRADQPQQ